MSGFFGVHPLAFAEISVQDASSPQTLTTQNTFYAISQWTTNQAFVGVIPNFSAGTLTVNSDGYYWTCCTLSVQSANNQTFKAALFVNGVIHQNGKVQWSTSGITGTPTINISITDINHYTIGDVLDIRATCTTGSNIPLTVLQGNFLCKLNN